MFELQIYIPLTDNQNREYSEIHHMAFEKAAVERFGGLSLLPGSVAGQWADQGEIYHDTLRVYSIAMKSITQGTIVGELVEIAKAHYRQEAIYIRYLGQAETL